MIIEDAKNPVRSGDQSIDLMVKFHGFAGYVPFTSTPYDSEKHSRDLYNDAVKGKFGPVA